jgi:hypothetical protein
MTQKVQVLLVDDLDGTEAHETVTFSLDGSTYEVDLNSTNAAQLRSVLTAYVNAGRRRAKAKAVNKSAGASSRSTISRERSQQIRAWAAETGVQLSERGRIPGHVIQAFDAEH